MYSITFVILLIATLLQFSEPSALPCDHEIYCYGDILHAVNRAQIFKDSKTFVDMRMKHETHVIKTHYETLVNSIGPNMTPEEVQAFIDHNFHHPGSEFEPWIPEDWQSSPRFLERILDHGLREFGSDLNAFWKELGRKLRTDEAVQHGMHSMIHVPNPVIVPGGRFMEFYYWDQYWILKGLLHSEMYTTVRGMLENFFDMVKFLGYIPNGGRIYYQRSQPPLLVSMVKDYVLATGNQTFLVDHLNILDKEFDFWMKNRLHTVKVDEGNGKMVDYQVARYNVEAGSPRPEAYNPDFELVSHLSSVEEQNEVWMHLKTAAESGIDFSSRWFLPDDPTKEKADLLDIKTRFIIPVELNVLIQQNARTLAQWHRSLGNLVKAGYYSSIADQWELTLNKVFWNEREGCWFDYVDYKNHTGHKLAFYPTNILPLMLNVSSMSDKTDQVIAYLKRQGVLSYEGGIPSSLEQSGEQWDFPNGWAPHIHWFIEALEMTGHAEANQIAVETAQKWVTNNFATYHYNNKTMFEKYDVSSVGTVGGGGEYEVVVGFGWTNGVILDLLHKYGQQLIAPQLAGGAGSADQVLKPAFDDFRLTVL